MESKNILRKLLHLHVCESDHAKSVEKVSNSTTRLFHSWIREFGFEWFYRWIQKPGSLWGRYLKTIPSFERLATKQLLCSTHVAEVFLNGTDERKKQSCLRNYPQKSVYKKIFYL